MEIFIPIIVLFILWTIANCIVKIFIKKYYNLNDLVTATLKNRKTIMFDIISLIIIYILKFKFLIWITIIYYIVITILEAILIIISFITGFIEDYQKKVINKAIWILLLSNFINEISNIIMLYALFEIKH